MILDKAQQEEYERLVWYGRGETCMVAMADLLKHNLANTQAAMVLESDTVRLRQMQGESQMLQRFLKFLTVPPREPKSV